MTDLLAIFSMPFILILLAVVGGIVVSTFGALAAWVIYKKMLRLIRAIEYYEDEDEEDEDEDDEEMRRL